MDWREKLFGKNLVRCGENALIETIPTLQALTDCVEEGEGSVCGIYFSFANISDESDDFGVRLEQVYNKVLPRLKVVEVVLWAHVGTPEGPVEREAGFRRTLTGKPWLAVPFNDVDTKRRLTQKYSIAVGVPTLVIRGRPVRDALLADPQGERFPWPAPPLHELLRGVQLQGDGVTTAFEDLEPDALRVFYFAAHWCPPCRAFSPSVCAALGAVRKRRAKYANTQLILVSSDRSEQSYNRTLQSVSTAGALAVPWGSTEARLALPAALAVAGIPALVITDAAGNVVASNGRRHLAADPLGFNFPWAQRPVSVLTEQALLKMARHPAVVLFIDDEDSEIEFAESVLLPSAESYYEECIIQFPGFCPYQNSSDDESMDFDYPTSKHSRIKRKPFKHVMFFIGIDGTDCADMLREHICLDDAVPLLTAIDFPKQRMVTMKFGDEITTDSVQNFVDSYLSGNAEFKPLKPYNDEDSEIEFAESVLLPSAESYYEECIIQFPGFCPYQNSSDDESMDFDYPTSKHSRIKRKPFKHVMFFIGIDGTDCADMLREHICLDDAVPLLTAIDFPKQRMVTMKFGDEITTDSVQNFVDSYLSGNAEFKPLKPYSEKC